MKSIRMFVLTMIAFSLALMVTTGASRSSPSSQIAAVSNHVIRPYPVDTAVSHTQIAETNSSIALVSAREVAPVPLLSTYELSDGRAVLIKPRVFLPKVDSHAAHTFQIRERAIHGNGLRL